MLFIFCFIPIIYSYFTDLTYNEINERLLKLNSNYAIVKNAYELFSIDYIKDVNNNIYYVYF